MKTPLAILLLLSWICSYSQAEKELPDHYLFDQVLITGATNMNQFHLSYREKNFSEIPSVSAEKHETFSFSIPAGRIKAESKMMRDDFLEMINARKYPDITITLDENIAGELPGKSALDHLIGLRLNGVTNSYRVRSEKDVDHPEYWRLSGVMKIKLSNFGIDPPRKFLGLVKVEDEVLINFKILFASTKK